jgi:hypothetical protein
MLEEKNNIEKSQHVILFPTSAYIYEHGSFFIKNVKRKDHSQAIDRTINFNEIHPPKGIIKLNIPNLVYEEGAYFIVNLTVTNVPKNQTEKYWFPCTFSVLPSANPEIVTNVSIKFSSSTTFTEEEDS